MSSTHESATHESATLEYVDLHTAGEPVRIVTGGYPALQGATLLAKRRDARDRHDHLRRAMMHEPRGHAGMYGVIPLPPTHPEAVLSVLFTHHEGYSTMCGHATIALGRWIVEAGLVEKRVPVTTFTIEAPCGLLRLTCEVDAAGTVGEVGFVSVPAFVEARDLGVDMPGLGRVAADIAYGGAFYAILPSSRLGLDFFDTPVEALQRVAGDITDALRKAHPLTHPDASDLGFLYGTILTDDAVGADESWNLCIFADRQIDRSPTGSGVTARMALDGAKGLVAPGVTRRFRGISGGAFTGRIAGEAEGGAVHVEVSGRAFHAGRGTFAIEPDDPLRHGFALASRFGEIRRRTG